MSNEVTQPPSPPVWWKAQHPLGSWMYTKARLWIEARSAFGWSGCDPTRVRDTKTLKELEEAEGK